MVRISLSLLILVVVVAQKTRAYSEEHEEDEEDVRRAIPGEPGRDYPTLAEVPATSFSCIDRSEGFYADPGARCQVFHICTLQKGVMGRQSFLCPNGTIFNPHVNTCDWWNKVHCESRLDPYPETEDNRQIYSDAEESSKSTLKLKVVDRTKLPSGRRNPSEDNLKTFYETPIGKFNAIESRQKPELREKGSVQILNEELDQHLLDYSREPLSNSVQTEGYHHTVTQNFRKRLGTNVYPTTSPANNRVTEVSIKPRVHYTHSLKYISDNPLYSLNPLIHVARDSSLLSTFGESSDLNNKVTHPVERYVVNDVLPQYNYSKENTPTTQGPTKPKFQPGDEDNDPIIFPESNNDPLKFPNDENVPLDIFQSEIPLMLGIGVKPGQSVESNGVSQGDVINGDFGKGKTISSTGKPYQANNNETRNYLPPNPVLRVSSGYSFTPADVNNNYFNTPKTLKVTNSYSVEENFPTKAPEVNYDTVTVSDSLGNFRNTERPSVLQDENAFSNQDISRNGPPISVTSPQYVSQIYDVPSQNTGGFESNYNFQEPLNDTNVRFIDRFIVDEPHPQLSSINGYSQNSFDADTYITQKYNSNPVSSNYIPSPTSERNFLPGISQEIDQGTVSQPPSNVLNFLPSSFSNGDVSNFGSNTQNPISVKGVSYNNVPGHYITKGPPKIGNNRQYTGYRQNYELNSGNMLGFTEHNQQYQKSSSLSSLDQSRVNQKSQINTYSTTQRPEVVVTSPIDQGKSTFSQQPQPYTILNPLQLVSNNYGLPSEQPLDKNVSPSSNNYNHPYKNSFPSQMQQFSGPSQVLQRLPVPGNDHILTSEKSVEVVDSKEKENILSGLKISNVLPAVEAYSWSTVINPPTTTERNISSLSVTPQTSSADYQDSSATPFPPLFNNQNPSKGLMLDNIIPSTETNSLSSTIAPLPPSNGYVSSDSSSYSENNSNFYPPNTNSFPATDKTTATFFNNNEEVKLYTAPKTASPVKAYFSVTNDRPVTSSESLTTQTYANSFSTERNNLYSSFSTPKPFLGSQGPYVAPQRHFTILPDYREEGKQLLNPTDLLQINSLRSSTELPRDRSVESSELVKSIGFSFDYAEDREQFEIAKSKGWFS